MRYDRGMAIGDGSQASKVWEFRVTDDLNDGDSISGVTVTADTGVTASLVTFDGDSAFVRISGGTAGTTYAVSVVVSTTGGDTQDILVNYEVANP